MISTSNNKSSEVTDSNLLQREGLKQVFLNDKIKDNNGESQKERTLALISYNNDNLEDMLNHIEKDGFTIVKTKTLQLNLEQAQEFYADHSTQNYYDKMIKWLSSGSNICALILEKENAVKDWRFLMGPTNYKKARKSNPNSIRAVFYKDASLNATHGSDSDASVEKEIDFIFGQDAAKSLPHTHQNNVSDVVENQSMVPNDVNETEKVKEKNVLPVESMNTKKPESDKPSSTSIVPEKSDSDAVHHGEKKDATQVDKSQSEKAQNETKNVTTPVIVSNENTRASNEKVETESISDNSVNTKQANETISKDVTPIKENNNIETEEKIQTPVHINETPSVTENMEKKEETTQPKEREIASAHKEEETKSDKLADKKDTIKTEVEEKKEIDSAKAEEKKDTVDTKVEDKKEGIAQNAELTQLEEKENKKEEAAKDSLVIKDPQEEKKATTTQEEEKEEFVVTATPSESSENDLSTNASTDLDNEQEIKGVDTTLEGSESNPLKEESSAPIKSESTVKSKKDSQLKKDNAGTKASRDIPKKLNGNKETSRIRPPSIKKGQSGNISTTGISRPTTIKSNVTMNSSSGTTRIARLSPSATINKESSTNDKKKAPPTTATSTRDSSGVPSAAKKPVTKVSRNLPRVAMIAAQKPVAAAKKVVEEEVEKKPKKKTSSTRSFISRLTAPTVASANKKAETDVPAVVSTPKRSAPSSKRSSIVRPAVSSSKDISSRNNKQKKEEQEPTAGGLATMNINETEVST